MRAWAAEGMAAWASGAMSMMAARRVRHARRQHARELQLHAGTAHASGGPVLWLVQLTSIAVSMLLAPREIHEGQLRHMQMAYGHGQVAEELVAMLLG